MTDNLRDRIAKVLYRVYGPCLAAHPDGWEREPGATQDMYCEDADAVIAELGLRREWGLLDQTESGLICDSFEEAKSGKPLPGESLHTRLVTDWVDVPQG